MLMPSLRHCSTILPFLLIALLGVATESRADSTHGYTINSITPANAGDTSILIGTHCTHDVTSIKVEVTSAKAVSIAEAHVSAYFYDADKNLIQSHYRPPTAPCGFVGHEKPVQISIMYEAGKPRIFYFPTEGPRPLPWKSIVVLFGDDEKMIAQVYPSGDPRDFDFPERELLVPR